MESPILTSVESANSELMAEKKAHLNEVVEELNKVVGEIHELDALLRGKARQPIKNMPTFSLDRRNVQIDGKTIHTVSSFKVSVSERNASLITLTLEMDAQWLYR